MLRDLCRGREPWRAHASLVRTHSGPESPHLVGELATDSFGMGQPFTWPVGAFEQTVNQLRRMVMKRGAYAAARGVKVRDAERGVPGRVYPAVHEWRLVLGTLLRAQRVVLLVRVLTAGVHT